MNNEMTNNTQPEKVYAAPKFLTRKTKRLIFYTLMIALPFLQFLLFYVYVHIDSFAMAFRVEMIDHNGLLHRYYSWDENFKAVFAYLKADEYIGITNSLRNYFITFFTSGILSIFFSYYVYKKFIGSGVFKVFLYLPSIISAIILVVVYKEILNRIIPTAYNEIFGLEGDQAMNALLNSDKDKYTWVLAYAIFMGFGGNILMYTGAMSGINESVVESAQLDGVNAFQEFWYITLPLIYPTFVTFTITGIAAIFTGHPNLHTFFGMADPFTYKIHTLGFTIFASVREGSIITTKAGNLLSLTQVSALGLLISAVMLPTTLILKKVMTKYGPSTD